MLRFIVSLKKKHSPKARLCLKCSLCIHVGWISLREAKVLFELKVKQNNGFYLFESFTYAEKKIKIMQCPVAPCGEGDGTRRFSRVFSSDLSSGRAAGSWALLLPFLFCITLLLELPFWKCFFFLECPQAWVRGEHLVVQQDPEGRVVFCSLRCAQLRAACHMSPKYTRSICSLVCWPGICTCAKPALS